MNAALDACERIDELGHLEDHRAATVAVNGHLATVFDLMQSSFTYPENLRYSIIRARNQLKEDKPYTTEVARTLQNVALLCSELIGCSKTQQEVLGVNPHDPNTAKSIEAMIQELTDWYQETLTQGVTKAVESGNSSEV